ncbi:MAG: glycosyltransferase family 4 protein [Thermovirgaceae bacterium]
MDTGKVEPMKIIQILPGLEEGGVERHVLWLSNELASRGHEILVVSSGGKLEGQFEPSVKHWRLPVHVKNPVTGAWCAARIAWRVKREKWDVLHAHSRVPIWITWWSSAMSKAPWVSTAHALYTLNAALNPLRRAEVVICVSQAVRDHLKGWLPPRNMVIYNGLPQAYESWDPGPRDGMVRFLFLGRLVPKKGLQVVLKALGEIREKNWRLDVVGDGSFRPELEALARELKIAKRVAFHGFRDDTGKWMKECDCFLFPSLEEGMGLTLMQAIHIGVPILASDIPAARELAAGEAADLISPGDVKAWRRRLKEVIRDEGKFSYFDGSKIGTVADRTDEIEKVYAEAAAAR